MRSGCDLQAALKTIDLKKVRLWSAIAWRLVAPEDTRGHFSHVGIKPLEDARDDGACSVEEEMSEEDEDVIPDGKVENLEEFLKDDYDTIDREEEVTS